MKKILSRPMRLFGALLLTSSLLVGCQSLPTQQAPLQSPAERWSSLRALTRWQAQGKIAIRSHDQRQAASFDWQQLDGSYAIRLFGPFGHGATWLRHTVAGVTLESARTGLVSASTAEELMASTLGWQVPISELPHWAKGIPSPVHPVDQLQQDEHGHIIAFEQQGWHIQYSAFRLVDNLHLPAKLTASRDDLSVVMVIKDWTLDSDHRL